MSVHQSVIELYKSLVVFEYSAKNGLLSHVFRTEPLTFSVDPLKAADLTRQVEQSFFVRELFKSYTCVYKARQLRAR